MDRPKADSFTAYLEAKQSERSQQAPTGGTAFSLLNILAVAPNKQLPATKLMDVSGMSPDASAEALKSLAQLGYVTIEGPPLSAIITLTSLGEEVSRLARK